MGLKRRPCICKREPYAWFYGDDPRQEPGLEELPAADRYRCKHGVVWSVSAIPGGGIYGDVEWRRVES